MVQSALGRVHASAVCQLPKSALGTQGSHIDDKTSLLSLSYAILQQLGGILPGVGVSGKVHNAYKGVERVHLEAF